MTPEHPSWATMGDNTSSVPSDDDNSTPESTPISRKRKTSFPKASQKAKRPKFGQSATQPTKRSGAPRSKGKGVRHASLDSLDRESWSPGEAPSISQQFEVGRSGGSSQAAASASASKSATRTSKETARKSTGAKPPSFAARKERNKLLHPSSASAPVGQALRRDPTPFVDGQVLEISDEDRSVRPFVPRRHTIDNEIIDLSKSDNGDTPPPPSISATSGTPTSSKRPSNNVPGQILPGWRMNGDVVELLSGDEEDAPALSTSVSVPRSPVVSLMDSRPPDILAKTIHRAMRHNLGLDDDIPTSPEGDNMHLDPDPPPSSPSLFFAGREQSMSMPIDDVVQPPRPLTTKPPHIYLPSHSTAPLAPPVSVISLPRGQFASPVFPPNILNITRTVPPETQSPHAAILPSAASLVPSQSGVQLPSSPVKIRSLPAKSSLSPAKGSPTVSPRQTTFPAPSLPPRPAANANDWGRRNSFFFQSDVRKTNLGGVRSRQLSSSQKQTPKSSGPVEARSDDHTDPATITLVAPPAIPVTATPDPSLHAEANDTLPAETDEMRITSKPAPEATNPPVSSTNIAGNTATKPVAGFVAKNPQLAGSSSSNSREGMSNGGSKAAPEVIDLTLMDDSEEECDDHEDFDSDMKELADYLLMKDKEAGSERVMQPSQESQVTPSLPLQPHPIPSGRPFDRNAAHAPNIETPPRPASGLDLIRSIIQNRHKPNNATTSPMPAPPSRATLEATLSKSTQALQPAHQLGALSNSHSLLLPDGRNAQPVHPALPITPRAPRLAVKSMHSVALSPVKPTPLPPPVVTPVFGTSGRNSPISQAARIIHDDADTTTVTSSQDILPVKLSSDMTDDASVVDSLIEDVDSLSMSNNVNDIQMEVVLIDNLHMESSSFLNKQTEIPPDHDVSDEEADVRLPRRGKRPPARISASPEGEENEVFELLYPETPMETTPNKVPSSLRNEITVRSLSRPPSRPPLSVGTSSDSRLSSISARSASTDPLALTSDGYNDDEPLSEPGSPAQSSSYITWRSVRRAARERKPEYLQARDLPHKLQDYMNALPAMFRKSDGARLIFEAAIRENTADDEPDAPPISIINPLKDDDEATPPWEFHYTNRLWHGDGVPAPDLKSLKGCDCLGRCDPKSKTCACVKKQSKWIDKRGFVYNNKGRLIFTSNYPIFECNDFCGCGEECQNRVVQHGRKCQVNIVKTKGKGWGVFAGAKRIPAGTFVGIYAGELLRDSVSEERGLKYNVFGRTYLFEIDGYHIQETIPGFEVSYVVDAYHAGNFTRFLNHSCEPNCIITSCYINEGDIEKPLLTIFAMADIEPNEELSFSYSGDNDEDAVHTVNTMNGDADVTEKGAVYAKCLCGAPRCKGVMFK